MTIARPDQYIALPCSGSSSRGIARGHVYKIKDKDKIFVSSSDTLCDKCFDLMMEIK